MKRGTMLPSTQHYHNQVIELKEEVSRLKASSNWISVEDRLPECDVPVLVYFGDPEINLEIDYTDVEVEYGTEFFANCGDDVTHWMPLPEPPSE